MMVMAEIFEEKALLLDGEGRIWQFRIGHDGQPEVQMLERISHETIKRVMGPRLASYVPHQWR